MKQSSNPPNGFTLPELSIYTGILTLLVLFIFLPNQGTLEKTQTNIYKDRVLYQINAAKNRFDQEAHPQDKRKFDTEGENERYSFLTPYLGNQDLTQLLKDSHIKHITVNKLGQPVQAN